jgi:peroxin-19
MLDDFSAVKIDAPKPEAPPGPGPASPPAAASAAGEDALSEEDFAKQLQAGMADLLGELETSVRVAPMASCHTSCAANRFPKPEMQAQFESIFKELGAAASKSADPASTAPTPPAAAAGAAGSSSSAAGASNAEASFQETIRRTMERMQTSGEQATAAAAAEGSDDFLAELLKQMQSGGMGGLGLDGDGGGGSEEDFSKMLMGMMEQLTNKEILYEPMKELDDKFPAWLDKNRDKTSAEELKRYEEQRVLVGEIVARFEQPTYSDANTADREYIVDRMQKVSCPSLYLIS